MSSNIADVDFALLAASAYKKKRDSVNRIFAPSEWEDLSPQGGYIYDEASGFEAVAYRKGNEIVIAYAGTDEGRDWLANLANGSGVVTSAQLKQAAKFYAQVRAAFGANNTNYTFTGHSLGGGLAALMGVFFNHPATTFDPAPFRLSANNDTRDTLKQWLTSQGLLTDVLAQELDGFHSDMEATGSAPSEEAGIRGETGVTRIAVQNEALTKLSPSGWFIGNGPQIIEHGSPNFDSFELHSIALLIALKKVPSFKSASESLPNLIPLIFDTGLYRSEVTSEKTNFMEYLVRHEVGIPGSPADGLLTKFTADLQKISASQGQIVSDDYLNKALLSFSMQAYYEQPGNLGAGLFEQVSGGLKFSIAKVSTDVIGNVKGYQSYFQSYLWTTRLEGDEAWLAYGAKFAGADKWFIAGDSMNAMAEGGAAFMLGGNSGNQMTGGTGADFIVGGSGVDQLTGGAGADVLLGGADNDTLHGADGAGGDILDGGAGNDTYYVDDGDTIRDIDGKGTVYLNDKKLTFAIRHKGDTVWKDNAGNTYTLANGALQINDPLTIEGFDNGALGIYLDDAEDPDSPPQGPAYNPNNASLVRRIDPLVLDLDGNGQIDTIASTASTTYFDFNGDGIAERSGWIAPQDGLLALDSNDNGVIDDLTELFGSNQQDGFAELREHDGNHDDVIDTADADFSRLKIWQDSNQDGISQLNEIHDLDALGITRIDLATTPANVPLGDNLLTAIGSYTRNGETHLAADLHLAVNFALTDANPNRPLGQAPDLDGDIFDLPWLRGYGDVKSLHIAYQEDPALKQAAADLTAKGGLGVLRHFDTFIAQWSGLAQAHQDHNVSRTSFTTEDKAWMLEKFTSQNVNKSAIEAANFGTITPGANRLWNTSYVNGQWQNFFRRAALSFAIQAESKEWLKGASYSLNNDRFIVLDTQALQGSLAIHLGNIADKEDAVFAAIVLSRLKQDGVALDAEELIQEIDGSSFETLFSSVLASPGGTLLDQLWTGDFHVDTGMGIVAWGLASNDVLYGGGGNDVLDGGEGSDTLLGGAGDDIYVFGKGYGQDVAADTGSSQNGGDTVRMAANIVPSDVTVMRDSYNLYLSLNNGLDRLTLTSWFAGYSKIGVTFADGTVWDAASLLSRIEAALPSESADNIYDGENVGNINGLEGNDHIYGFGGNDALSGGDGSDTLDGGVGDDFLDGGVGSDYLKGQGGNDTYIFGNGYGQDRIENFDWPIGGSDDVRMLDGVSPDDVTVTRDGSNLYLSLINGVDRLTIQGWFYDESFKIDRVLFSDGTVWTTEDLTDHIVAAPATSGDDLLYGGEDGDVIGGQEGNDQLFGNGGNDALNGGIGADYLAGGLGDDILDGGVGNDTLWGGAGNDTYVLGYGSGQDVVLESGDVDTIQCVSDVLPENVTVTRDAENLYLSLGAGEDRLTIQGWFSSDASKIDRVIFENGTVWDLKDIERRILLSPTTDGNDVFWGNAEDNVIDGLNGDDLLEGYEGADTLRGDGGADRVLGEGGGDALDGGSGNDVLNGGSGNDVLDGGSGNDALDGGSGDDVYWFGRGDGQDIIASYDLTVGKHDVVRFKEGIAAADVVANRNGQDLMLAIVGTEDQLTVKNFFVGTSSNPYGVEAIEFFDGTKWGYADLIGTSLTGTDNGDFISGHFTDDVLIGQAGRDYLSGYSGEDILDGGTDSDTLDGGLGNDTYLFGHGSGLDVVIDYDAGVGGTDVVRMGAGVTPESVTVTRDQQHLYLSLNNGTDRLTLSNWFVDDAHKIERVEFADGYPSWGVADLLAQTAIINDGDNYLEGGSENDSLYGLGGDDQIHGLSGNDVLSGGAGNDLLYGETGNDVVLGGAGNDQLYGEAGDDVLDGGVGSDNLQGGTGNDTYLFGHGSGQDVITDYDAAIGGTDIVLMAAGVMPESVTVTRDQRHLYLSLNNGTDRLTLSGWFVDDAHKIERVEFADGYPSWSIEDLLAKTRIADNGDNYFEGGAGSDTLDGLGGNDQIHGLSGNDALLGSVGDDQLYGEAGDDVLDGGTGSDTLDGGLGNDTYLFGHGSGLDVVIDYDAGVGGTDVVRMGAGVTPESVTVTRDQQHLYLSLNNGTDRLTLSNWFVDDAHKIERVEFADGYPSWGVADLLAQTAIINDGDNYLEGGSENDRLDGLGGDDQIHGLSGNDEVLGGAGNDQLYGEAGDDVLDGGVGSDNLQGGTGNDTYIFGHGSGLDVVIDYDAGVGGTDVVRMGAGVTPESLTVTRDQHHLYLSLNNGTDRLTLSDWFVGDAHKIERVEFIDGYPSWSVADLLEKTRVADDESNYVEGGPGGDSLNGLGGNDQIYGLSGEDTLLGGEGDDQIFGNAGDDVLEGGAGFDRLDGGIGNDTYLFGPGSGADAIYDYDTTVGNVDRIVLADGVLPSDVTVTRDLNNLYLSLNGGADILTLSNWLVNDAYRIEKVQFSDGTEWTGEDLLAKLPGPTNGSDQLLGTGAGDTINGLAGNDMLQGLAGNDILEGGGGNDNLLGQDGDDTLDGGEGNDYLQGGTGNDTYLFGFGSGLDSIFDYDLTVGNVDTVRIAEGVSPDDVSVSGDSLGMYLSLNGGVDRLTFSNWFSANAFKIERILFSDGTQWGINDLLARMPAATNGNDFIAGTMGSDTLDGLAGDDVIQGLAGNDVLMGGSGNDVLYGQEGNDILDGGTGDDSLNGGGGNDTYWFGPGAGRDSVFDHDEFLGNVDTIQMMEGVLPSDVHVSRDQSSLYLSVNNGADRLTLSGWFYGGSYQVEKVVFADGTIWNSAQLRAFSNTGSEGNDYIDGTTTNDLLEGLGGNDVLNGLEGDDVLDGGVGDDQLYGGNGSDNYLFARGGGRDSIVESAPISEGETDALIFGEGISPDSVSVLRGIDRSDNLSLILPNEEGRVDILGYFSNGGSSGGYGGEIASSGLVSVEEIRFFDGTVWDLAAIQALARLEGTAEGESLNGDAADNVLNGNGGDDALFGYNGNDVLDGGGGNDVLYGGAGNDIYLFGSGAGQDVVVDYDSTIGDMDTVRMADGIAPLDVTVTRDAENLYLAINNDADRLTLSYWFRNDAYRIERVEFSDSTVWSEAEILQRLDTGEGQDRNIQGTPLDDVLNGEGGNDQIYGFDGDDVLAGGAGDDSLWGGNGIDRLDGGSGNDALNGEAGNDTYLFGMGDGQDVITDVDTAIGNVDTVQMAEGILPSDVLVTHDETNLYLSLSDGADRLTIANWMAGSSYWIEQVKFSNGTVWTPADLLPQSPIGDDGDNYLVGTVADDVLNGMAGNDQIAGWDGNDTLSGGDGNDVLDGGSGDDVLVGDSGDDRLIGGTGQDTYWFGRGDGHDVIESNAFGEIDIVRFSNDVLPADVVAERQLSDLILRIQGTEDVLVLEGLFADAGQGVYSIRFSDGTEWTESDFRALPILGTEGDDSITGGDGIDFVQGLGGNDALYGYAGDDLLDGGAGDDRLDGGEGNDVYLFGIGDGQDRIEQYFEDRNQKNILRFKSNVNPGDVSVLRSNGDMVLSVGNVGDSVTVIGQFLEPAQAGYQRIYRIEFSNGIVWDAEKLKSLAAPLTTEEADYIVGTYGADHLLGLDGGDSLEGRGGNDVLDGGSGNDYLYGGVGSDVYIFGRGYGQDTINDSDYDLNQTNVVRFLAGVAPEDIKVSANWEAVVLSIKGTGDSLTIENALGQDVGSPVPIQRIEFDDGTQWDINTLLSTLSPTAATSGDDTIFGTSDNDGLDGQAGNDMIFGNDGEDVIDGGLGNDNLYGVGGKDIYFFGRGYGNDYISDWAATSDELNIVRFKPDISPGDVEVSRSGSAVVLSVLETGDTLTVSDYFADWGLGSVSSFEFSDGTVWNAQAIASLLPAQSGTISSDQLLGSNADDVLEAMAGDDQLFGSGGNDVLYGGDGSDTLYGGAGNDLLDGGSGDDSYWGGGGNDVYLFGRGAGHDWINSEYEDVSDQGKLDTVRFSPDISPSDIGLGRDGDTVILTVLDSGDTLSIQDYFGAESQPTVQTIEFADGTVWGSDTVSSLLPSMTGEDSDDLIFGTSLDDALIGKGGGDVLVGYKGDDVLNGGKGDDVYRYQLGDGNDVISDYDATIGNVDYLEFSGVTSSQVVASKSGYDLLLDIAEGGRVRVQNWYRGYSYHIEGISFDDLVWDDFDIDAMTKNFVPVVTPTQPTQLIGLTDSLVISSVFNVVDANGDSPTKYEIQDGVGSGYFVLSGVEQQAGGRFSVTAENFGSVLYVGSDIQEKETIKLRAFDGYGWSAWATASLVSSDHLSNTAPEVGVTGSIVELDSLVAAAGILSVDDADGDPALKYQFLDTVDGGGSFFLDGVAQAAGHAFTLSADQFQALQYVGGGNQGAETLKARAWDGLVWGGWKTWSMVSSDHATNAAPNVLWEEGRVGLNALVDISDIFSIADADGDPTLKYQFIDTGDGGGHFLLGNEEQAAGSAFSINADQLWALQYMGGGTQGVENLKARAWDGLAWGSWTSVGMVSSDHGINTTPLVVASDSSVGLNTSVAAMTLLSSADADGDSAQKYQFMDATNGGGYWSLEGAVQSAGVAFSVASSQLVDLQYTGAATQSTEKLKARAWDGLAWGAWTSWDMASSDHATNAAPVSSAVNRSVLAGQSLAASGLFSISDADGDAPVQYQFSDAVAGGGYFTVGDAVQTAGSAFTVNAADLGQVSYVGGAGNAVEQVKVRANDGLAWGAWKTWKMTSVGFQSGTSGNDSLAGTGSDILLGQDGNDTLSTPSGNGLLSGGSGDDTLTGGNGSDFYAGGTGNDTLHTGSGNDVIAFNAGDGHDSVYFGGGSDTVSLGGGINYQNMALRKNGNDLVLETGGNDDITFKNWYAAGGHGEVNLQVIADAMAEFSAQSADPLLNTRVQNFDLDQLAAGFDAARAADATLTRWNVMDKLLEAHLDASNDGAIGGDLAYQYGNGSWSNVGLEGARNVLVGSQFGIGIQAFQSLQGLQEGVAKLG